jgi:hypothetical protein
MIEQVIELEEFLDFMGEEKNFKDTNAMKELVSLWRNRYPSPKVDDIRFVFCFLCLGSE